MCIRVLHSCTVVQEVLCKTIRIRKRTSPRVLHVKSLRTVRFLAVHTGLACTQNAYASMCLSGGAFRGTGGIRSTVRYTLRVYVFGIAERKMCWYCVNTSLSHCMSLGGGGSLAYHTPISVYSGLKQRFSNFFENCYLVKRKSFCHPPPPPVVCAWKIRNWVYEKRAERAEWKLKKIQLGNRNKNRVSHVKIKKL